MVAPKDKSQKVNNTTQHKKIKQIEKTTRRKRYIIEEPTGPNIGVCAHVFYSLQQIKVDRIKASYFF
jgi:hypothetical protein